MTPTPQEIAARKGQVTWFPAFFCGVFGGLYAVGAAVLFARADWAEGLLVAGASIFMAACAKHYTIRTILETPDVDAQ